MYAFPCGILGQQIKHDHQYSSATEEQINYTISLAVTLDDPNLYTNLHICQWFFFD